MRFLAQLAAGLLAPLLINQATANPGGASVVSGAATLHADAQRLDIHQSTQRAIIDWQSFNISSGETTQFHHPSASSATLNRVVTSDPSAIYGTLRANGSVYLINPNGIVVGENGVIDTHSFIASTLDVTNAEFLSGGDMLFAGNSDAAIINLGRVSAVGGDVYLIAHKVVNEGEIQAHDSIGLAAGGEILLQAAGDERISIRLQADHALIEQQGLLEAARVQLAAAGNNPYALAINHSGISRATGAAERDGRIVLSADVGSNRVGGTLQAAGGDIHLLGDQVTVVSDALVDVSSVTSGGEILVGGNFQGRGPEQNAVNTVIESGAQLRADATLYGDGGRVIVWADDTASVSGEISVRGGRYGGDGGFVETSAAGDLVFDVSVDASAPMGESGLWMIDPVSITIDRTMADAIERALDSDTSVLVTTYTGWPLYEGDTITGQDGTELIHSTADLSDPGHITLAASITKRIADQEFVDQRMLQASADVPVGASVEPLAGDEDPVRVSRREPDGSGGMYLVDLWVARREDAIQLVAADPVQYSFEELDDNVMVVWQTIRDPAPGFSVPTLEILSPEGNIYINESITSINGQLNVVLNAGARSDFTHRNEGVYINADIHTNGGYLLVRGAGVIDVADNTLISTRDVFGVDASTIRFLESDTAAVREAVMADRDDFFARNPGFTLDDAVTVPTGQLLWQWHDAAQSQGWSGDIMMMLDKNIGYSNFYLFYRSDVSGIRIGDNARLLAHADQGREGSIRLLSLSNLTDLFESGGWLGVRNYASATLDIGDGAWLKGGVIDLIADARADADVGSLIAMVTDQLASATDDSGLVATVSVNNEDAALSAGENIANLIMDISASGRDIHQEMGEADEIETPIEFEGFQGQAKLPIAFLGNLAVEHIDKVPFIGEILSLSPIAIAIAEADASVNVGNNVRIEGGGLVTVTANAESSASGSATAPGLALSLTVTNADSDVSIGSGSEIVSRAEDRNAGSSLDPLVTGQPFFQFETTGYFGISRDYLDERSTDSALQIYSTASTSSNVDAEAGALTEEISSSILQRAEEDRARSANEGVQHDKSVNIDSPVDIALGISIVRNHASLHLAETATLEALQGTVQLLTQTTNALVSSVEGGSVVMPEVDTGEAGDGSDGSIGEALDGNDIINMGISIQYSDVHAESRIDGTVRGRQVDIAAVSAVESHANTVRADNGYANIDPDEAVKEKLRADTSRTANAARDTKKWLLSLWEEIKGRADEQTNEQIPVEDGDGPTNIEFGLAGAVAVTVADYNVDLQIGATALIEAIEPVVEDAPALSLTASHSSGVIHNSANAGVHAGRKNATAAAISVSVINNDVSVDVADGAQVRVIQAADASTESDDETRALLISANTTIESPFSLDDYESSLSGATDIVKLIDEPGGYFEQFSPIEMGKNTVTNMVRNGHLLTTNWANGYVVPGDASQQPGDGSTTPSANDDFSSDIAIGGSFGLIVSGNKANVNIGAATIEVLNGVPGGRNDIDIHADAWAHTIMAAGSIAPPEFGGAEGTFELDDIFNGDSAGVGIGGAINLAFVENEAHVNIRDGASLKTTGELVTNAVSHYETVLIQVAGGKAEDVGVSGSFGMNWLDQHASTLVADGAVIEADSVRIGAATNLPGNIVMSGGFAFSETTGIGAGVAINRVVRSAVAELGHEGEGDQAAAGGSVTANNVRVDAVSSGFVTGIGLAGGVQTPGSFQGDDATTQVTEAGSGESSHESAGGVGISGSVAVNLMVSETQALTRINNGHVGGRLDVSAIDAVDVTGISGGAALTVTGGAAVAGAASINRIENHTHARLTDSDVINGHVVNVDAASIGRIQGVAVGLALTTEAAGSSDADDLDVAIAGSFTYNEIQTNTLASIVRSQINLVARPEEDDDEDELDAVRVTATDGSQIVAVAGAIAIDASSGGDAAVGAGVAVNLMQGEVRATIEDSEIVGTAPDVLGVGVAANRIAPIYSFGVAGAGGTANMAAAASVGVNLIDSDANKGTFAHIHDSAVSDVGHVTVQSASESQILSLAGAIAGTSGDTAIGGAISISMIGSTVSALITDTDIETAGEVGVYASTASATAQPDPEIELEIEIDIDLEDVKNAGKTAFQYYSNPVVALINERENAVPPSISPVDTIDLFGSEAAIYTLAAAGGGAANAAVFGSANINLLTNEVIGAIRRSGINADSIQVLADNGAAIYSASGALAISGGAASVGGSMTYNTLRGSTLAEVSDADIVVNDRVYVGADRSGTIRTLAAAASVASTTGIQGSAAISTFADHVEARVLGADIAADRVDVRANETIESTTAAGGLSGGGTTAVGGSTAILVSENTTRATVGNSGTDHARINVIDSLEINATSAELHNSTVMTASLSAKVGIAGSAGVKVMNAQTHATLGDNSVINDQRNGTVSVLADSKLFAVGEAGGVGIGIGATGIGAGLDLVIMNGVTSAVIGDGANVRGRDVTVRAQSAQDIASLAAAGGGGFVGIAGGVSIVHVGGGEMAVEGRQALGQESYEDAEGNQKQDGDMLAHITDYLDSDYSGATVDLAPSAPAEGNTLAYIGASVVRATDNLSVEAIGHHDVDVSAGALAGGVVGAGAGVASVTYNSQTAAITRDANLFAGNKLSVIAHDRDVSSHRGYWQLVHDGEDPGTGLALGDGDWFAINAFAGSGGLVGLGASIAVVYRDNSTLAEIRGGTADSNNEVLVDADRHRHTRTFALGAQAGGFTLGASIADVTEQGQVLASAGGEIGAPGGDATIREMTVSANADNRNVMQVEAAAVGIVTGNAAVALSHGDAVNSEARIADDAVIHVGEPVNLDTQTSAIPGDLNLRAEGTHRDHIEVTTASISKGASVGAAEARAQSRAITAANVGSHADVFVESNFVQESRLNAGAFNNGAWTPYTNVIARGGTASALVGVASVFASSEQVLQSSVGVGANASVHSNGGYWFNGWLVHHGLADSLGGSVAGLAAVGVVTAENNDQADLLADIGENASVTTHYFSSLLRNLPFYGARTRALAGSIASANVVQNTHLDNDSTTAQFNLAQGAHIDAIIRAEIDVASTYLAFGGAQGHSGGASAVNIINAGLDADNIIAHVQLDGARISAGNEVVIRTNTAQSVHADFNAEALGLGAYVEVNVDTALDGYGRTHLLNGASLEAANVNVSVANQQLRYLVSGRAAAVAAGANVAANVNNNLRMDSQIFLEDTTSIIGADINLSVDDNAALRHSSVEAELENISLTFFLSQEDYSDNQVHGKQIRLDGDLVSTSRFGQSVDIETFGQYVLVNGVFQSDMNLGGPGESVLLDTIAPAGSGSVFVSAGNGQVTGSGVIRNASNYFTDVTVRARNSVRVSDIRLTGDPSDLDVTIESGNSYTPTFVTAPAPSGGEIRFEVGDTLVILGLVDAADGSIVVNAGTDRPFWGNVRGSGVLRANHVEIHNGGREIGSAEASLVIQLLHTATADAWFEAHSPMGIFADITLHSDSNNATLDRAVIGDVRSSGPIRLEFQDGVRADGSAAMAIYEIQGEVGSRGEVMLDASATNTSLIINGEVRSGVTADVTEVYVNILDEDVIDTNWDDLFVLFQTSEVAGGNKLLTVGNISNDGGSGVIIEAANLSGNGLVYGNGAGLDVTIDNSWEQLTVLQLGSISLMGSAAAVMINGDDAVASNDFGNIQIERIVSAGTNDITITDHWSGQLVMRDTVETSGKISIDMDNAFYVSTFDVGVGLDPILRGQAIDLRLAGAPAPGIGSTIGLPDRPFLVDVGDGGLHVESDGRMFIRDVGDELVLRGIDNTPALVAGAISLIVIESANGSIIARDEGNYVGDRFELRAAGDIDFSDVVVQANDKVRLEGDNVSWRAAYGINLNGVSANGDLLLRDENGFGIIGGGVNVQGETRLVGDGDISLVGNFGGALHIEGINGPNGHNWGFAQVVTPGDLLLGDIKTGFAMQADPAGSLLRLTAGGDIVQTAGSSLSIHNNTTLTAGGAIVLDAATNQFDAFENLRLIGDSAVLRADGSVNLYQLQIENDLAITLDGGWLTQTGFVRVGGTTDLATQGGNIELTHASNAFNGLVSVTMSGTAQPLLLRNAGTLRLGDIALSTSMTLSSGSGSVIGHGVVNISGFNRVDARNGSIIFDNPDNQLGFFGGLAADDVTLISGNSLYVNPFAIGGKLTLEADQILFLERSTFEGDFMSGTLASTSNSAGSMSLTARVGNLGTGDQAVAPGDLMIQPNRRFTVDGDVSLSSPFVVHFDNAAFGGTVNLDAAIGIISQQVGDLALGDVNVWGLAANTNLGDNSSIIGTGSIQVDNQAWFLTQGDLHLLNPTNRFAIMDVVWANDVVIRAESDLALRSGAQFVWDIALDSLDVEIGGNFSVAPTVAMPDWAFPGMGVSGDVIRVDGNARIVAGGDFGNLRSGLFVSGDTWLETGTGNLTVDANLNSFGGSLDLHAGGNLYVGFLSLLNVPGSDFTPGNTAQPLSIGSLSAGGNANVEGLTITLGDVLVGGDLRLSTDFYALGTSPGLITVNGVARVGGETTIRTMGDINLNNPLNDFIGDVHVFDVNTILGKNVDVGQWGATSGRRAVSPLGADWFWYRMPPAQVSIADRNQLPLGNVTLDTDFSAQAANIALNGTVQTPGNLSLIATTGSFTGAGSLIVGGDATLSSAGQLTLDGSYDIAGGLSLVGGGIEINVDDLVLHSLHSTAGLTVTANSFALAPANPNIDSTVTGDTLLNVAGNVHFAGRFSGYGDVTLNGVSVIANQPFTVGGVLRGEADSMNLTASDNLKLGALDIGNNLTLAVANGDISMVGEAIQVGGDLTLTAQQRDMLLDQMALFDVAGAFNATARNVTVVSSDALQLGNIWATDELAGQARVVGTDLQLGNVRASNIELIATDGNINAGLTGGDLLDGQYLFQATGDIDIVMRSAPTRFIGGIITASGATIRLDYESDGSRVRLGDITATGDLWLDNNSSDFDFQKDARGDGVLNIDGNLYAGFNSSLRSLWIDNPANRIGGSINFDLESAEITTAGTMRLDDARFTSDWGYTNLTSHDGNIEYIGTDSLRFHAATLTAENGNIILPRVHHVKDDWSGFGAFDVRAENVWITGSEDNVGLSPRWWLVSGDVVVDLSLTTNANADFSGYGDPEWFQFDAIMIQGSTTILTNSQSGVFLEGDANRFVGGIHIDTGSVVLHTGSNMTDNLWFMPEFYFVDSDPAGGDLLLPDPVHLDVGTFTVAGSVDIFLGPGGITFHDAIDTGALTFITFDIEGDITAAHEDNRIQAADGSADLSIVDTSFGGPIGGGIGQGGGLFDPLDPFDPSPGVPFGGNVHIVDSTDLSVNVLITTGDVELISAGSISMLDIPDPFDDLESSPAHLDVGGALRIRAVADFTSTAQSVDGGDVLIQAGGDIRLFGAVQSAGDIVLAAGGNFHNDSGEMNPLSANGRWLVYSTRPDHNSNDMAMDKDFFDYGVAFSSVDPQPAWLPAGNGLLYRVLPVIEGLTLSPVDQVIVYGQDINRDISTQTIGNLDGTATGQLLVDGTPVDAALFGIDVGSFSVDIDPADLVLDINESVVTRSGAGFVNVGSYANAIVVSVLGDNGSDVSVGIGGVANLDVTPLQLDAALVSVQDKVYDATTNATLNIVGASGVLAGDQVSYTGVANFASADAGVAIDVDATGIGIIGQDAGNYLYTGSDALLLSGTITPRTLTISLTPQSKVYDGTTLAVLQTGDYSINGFVADQSAQLDKNGVYNSANVANANQVSVSLDAADFINLAGGINLDNYQFSATVTGAGNISPAPLVLQVNNDSHVYNGVAFSGGNGVTATGFVGDETIASLNGDLVWGGSAQGAINVGSYGLTASGLTSSNYSIQYRSGTLSITPASLLVSVDDVIRTYDAQAFTGGGDLTLTGLQGSDTLASLGGALAWGGSAQGAVNAGDYTLTVGGLASSNYSISYQPGALVIKPAPLTVNINSVQRTYDGTTFNGGAGYSFSGFIAGEGAANLTGTLSWEGTAQGARDAGSYIISASGLSADNYAISYNNGTLQIDPRALGISLQPRNKVYDGTTNISLTTADFLLSGLVAGEQTGVNAPGQFNSSQVLHADTVTVLLTDASFINASGGFNIANYQYNGDLTRVGFGITPAPLQLRANDLSMVYQGVAFDGETGITANGLVNGETLADLDGTLSWTGSAVGAVNVGAYSALASGLSSDNYEIDYLAGTLQITPRGLTATPQDVTRTYNGLAHSGGSLQWSGFADGEDVSVLSGSLLWTGNAEGAIDAGDYVLRAAGLSSSNYQINWAEGSLQISPAALTIQVLDAQKTYDGQAWQGGNDVTYSGFVAAENESVLSGTLAFGGDSQGAVNAGSYALTASGLTSGNYTINWLPGSLVIDPRALTVQLRPQSKPYDGNTVAVLPGNAFLLSGFAAGEGASMAVTEGWWNSKDVDHATTVSANLTADDFVNAVGGFQSSNYVFPTLVSNNSSAINPVPLTVTMGDLTKAYDGQMLSGTPDASHLEIVGLVVGETLADLGDLAFDGPGATASNVGSYVLSLVELTTANYAVTYIDGTLSITPAALTATAQDISKMYDGTAHSGGTLVFSGFVGSEDESALDGTLVWTGTAEGAVNAGSYNLRAEGLTSDNYAIDFVDGQLQISPAALTVRAQNAEKTYDGIAWQGGNGVVVSGFVGSDTEASLQGNAQFIGSSQGARNAGTYELGVTGLMSQNYEIQFVAGQLVIGQRPLSISLNNLQKIYDGTTVASPGAGDFVLGGLVEGESAQISGAAGVWNSANVAQANAVTVQLGDQHFAGEQGGFNLGNYSYNPQVVNSSSSILPASLQVSVNDAEKTYDGQSWQGGNGVSYSGFVGGEDASVLAGNLVYGGTAQGAVNAGSYALTASGLVSGNYQIDWVPGTLVIDPRMLSVGLRPQSKVYDGTSTALLGQDAFLLSGFAPGERAVLGVSEGWWNSAQVAQAHTVSAQLTGDDFINPEGGFLASNYGFPSVVSNQDSTITPAALLARVQDVSRVYDGQAHSGGGLVFSGFVAGEDESMLQGTLQWSGTGEGAVDAGDYVLRAGGLSAGNYEIAYVEGQLRISPAALTVQALDAQKTYDAQPWQGGNGVSFSGFVVGEDETSLLGNLEFVGSSQGARNAGLYELGVSGLMSQNYDIEFVSGQLVVSPRPLSIRLNDQQKIYDGNTAAALEPGNFVVEGLVMGESTRIISPSGVWNSANVAEANTVSIELDDQHFSTGEGGFVLGNYSYAPLVINTNSTILPAPLQVSIHDAGKVYDAEAFTGGAGFSYSGFVADEDERVIDGMLVYHGDSQGAINAGVYLIDGSGLESDNYQITYQSGSLVITPRPLDIVLKPQTRTYDGTALAELNVTDFAITGFAATESAQLLVSQGHWNSANVSEASQITVDLDADSFLGSSGFDVSNYSFAERIINTQSSITPRPVTITAADVFHVFNGIPFVGGGDVIVSGLIGEETVSIFDGELSFGGDAQGAIEPGFYSLIAQGVSAENYQIFFVEGKLVLLPAVMRLNYQALKRVSTGNPIPEFRQQPYLRSHLHSLRQYPDFDYSSMEDEDCQLFCDAMSRGSRHDWADQEP